MADNFLDVAHFPFVHTSTFGAGQATDVPPYDVEVEPGGFRSVQEQWFANPEDPGVAAGIRPLRQRRRATYVYRLPFQLLLRRSQPDYTAPFELVAFSANSQRRNGDVAWSEATAKVKVKGELFHTAAEGNGPVNALDAAMRKALLNFYPELADISLADYKVRVLEGAHGTAARVRVLIESERSDGTRWTTVGSSENIIEASCRALTDSLEFVLTEALQPRLELA